MRALLLLALLPTVAFADPAPPPKPPPVTCPASLHLELTQAQAATLSQIMTDKEVGHHAWLELLAQIAAQFAKQCHG